MRLPRSGLGCVSWTAFLGAKSLPQTKQRVASSLTRVPQVGHSFVGPVSVVISQLIVGNRLFSFPNSGENYTSLWNALRIIFFHTNYFKLTRFFGNFRGDP